MSHSQSNEKTGPDAPFGEVIFSYTRAEAIADGVLVDVSETARETGFTVPVALTRAVWADAVAWSDADNERQTYQDEIGRLWDVLFMAAMAIRGHRGEGSVLSFEIARIPRDGKSTQSEAIDLKLHLGAGDHGEPVITIMEPTED